jgi:hypothetical protein
MTEQTPRVRRVIESVVNQSSDSQVDVQLAFLLEDAETLMFVLSRRAAGILVKKLLLLGLLPIPD